MTQTQTLHILLADDNEDDLLFIREAFTEARYAHQIDMVRDGAEVLAYLRGEAGLEAKRPDLIILDINMPRKNGLAALREIKSDPRLQAIPVVMLTTSDQENDIIASYSYGACSYIAKPVDFADLKQIIQHFEQYWTLVSKIPRP